jgi:hypothetical protein
LVGAIGSRTINRLPTPRSNFTAKPGSTQFELIQLGVEIQD